MIKIGDSKDQWLLECCNAETVMDTTFEFMYFTALAMDIPMNIFHYKLPPGINNMTTNNEKDIKQQNSKKIERSNNGK